MRAATLFSGIGAPEVAMPDWNWIWHAEIEKFPSAVMAARHPQSVNLGDVTADDFYERAIAIGRPDVLVFGSPCQSYSVAGQRLGLDDPRGNLALVALGIVQRLRPTWFVFENVPGLFLSWSGEQDGRKSSDFAAFLSGVQDSGYQCAWSVLDAQYFGVAQRRERVFVVGHADWRRAAAVLLEPESLCGRPPTRGEARQDITGTLESRSGSFGTDFACLGGLQPVGIPDTVGALADGAHMGGGLTDKTPTTVSLPRLSLCLNAGGMGRIDAESETLIPIGGSFDGLELAVTLTSGGKGARGYLDPVNDTLIAHSLRSDGLDASEDGTVMPIQSVNMIREKKQNGIGIGGEDDPMFTFTGRDQHAVAVCDPHQMTSATNRSQTTPELSHTLTARAEAPIAFRWCGDRKSHGVRRLMPTECERLQGFPDGHTAITYRGKPAADGPRYKAIGNSMAVPVLRWILSRIEQVEAIA